MPVPRRSGDNVPCSPERGCCAALRRRIPADCVLAGTDRIRCRTGRTSRRRLSYVHIRKERASFARAHPHKGFGARDDGRNGRGMPEVANLKHAARGMCRRVAVEPCGIRLNNRHEIFTGRHRSDRPDSPRKFARLPTRNVSCALHAVGGIGAAGRARAGLVVTMLLAHGTAMLGLARMERRRGRAVRAARHVRAASAPDVSLNPDTEPVHALDAPLTRRADAPRRRTARRRARRCCRDRSARARSSSGRASRAKCRVRRQPC